MSLKSQFRRPSADAKDTGRELTDEEWAEFFANELREDAGDSKEEEEVDDCQDDFTIPPSFADDEIRPGVSPYQFSLHVN